MPPLIRRHLELLALSQRLRRYARSLQPDANASSMLVHRVLAAAFAETPDRRPSAGLEASLQADIARTFSLRCAHACA